MAYLVVLLFIVLNMVLAVPVAFFMEWSFANSYQITAVVTAGVLIIQTVLEVVGILVLLNALHDEFFR